MRSNTDITLYNKYTNSTRAVIWVRTTIPAVTWDNRKAANVLQSGMLDANQASIFIPLARGANYMQPKAWQALTTKTGYWTLQPGDFVVKGTASEEITSQFSITDLKAKYDDVMEIHSIDPQMNGSLALRHWEVGVR